LKATCRARGQAWIEDPSNVSSRFARARLRTDRDVLAGHGLDAGALQQTATRMAQVRRLLEQETAGFLARHAALAEGHAITLDIAAFRAQPLEMRQRILGDVARATGGLDYTPRAAKLLAAVQAIAEPCFKRITLGHCLISRRRTLLRIEPENRAGTTHAASAGHAAGKGIFAIV
jgi:tRNA(Ile)-lysidine synthase